MQRLAPHKYKSYGEKDDDVPTMISTPPTKMMMKSKIMVMILKAGNFLLLVVGQKTNIKLGSVYIMDM